MFPIVLTTRFDPIETAPPLVPAIRPMGISDMLATECSNPAATKIVTGPMIASIFAGMLPAWLD